MKYIRKLLIVPMILLLSSAVGFAEKNPNNITVVVDDLPINFSATHNHQPLGYPEIKDGRTMIPLRAVAEGGLNYNLEWEQSTQTATLKKDDVTVKLKIGEDTALISSNSQENEVISLDSKAYIKDGRTYVPMRFIAEAMQDEVFYDRQDDSGRVNHTISVYSKDFVPSNSEKPIEPPAPPVSSNIGGTADYTNAETLVQNIEKINDYFGVNKDRDLSSVWRWSEKEGGGKGGMAVYNPIGTISANYFFYIQSNSPEDYDVKISIKNWYVPGHNGRFPATAEAYKSINPVMKEVLKFYLPNGYEKLYKIIDSGFNGGEVKSTLDKELKNIIGSDRSVVIRNEDRKVNIYIKK